MNAYATLEMLKSQSALDIQGAAHDRRLISLLEGVSRQVVLTGMLGAVEGIPVIVSEQMRPADTDGMVTAAGNNTDTGRLLLVNRTQWAQGFRRGPSMDVARDAQRRPDGGDHQPETRADGTQRRALQRNSHRAGVQHHARIRRRERRQETTARHSSRYSGILGSDSRSPVSAQIR